jgi:hypothetical protein
MRQSLKVSRLLLACFDYVADKIIMMSHVIVKLARVIMVCLNRINFEKIYLLRAADMAESDA